MPEFVEMIIIKLNVLFYNLIYNLKSKKFRCELRLLFIPKTPMSVALEECKEDVRQLVSMSNLISLKTKSRNF